MHTLLRVVRCLRKHSSAFRLLKMAERSIRVCDSCVGSDALLADLEDLCPLVGVRVKLTHCLNRCKSGPNCQVTVGDPSGRTRRWRRILTERFEFEDSLEVVALSSGLEKLDFSEPTLQRTRLRSDAIRRTGEGLCKRSREDLLEAERLLSEALAAEAAALEPASSSSPPKPRARPTRAATPRTAELRLLRGRVRGSDVLAMYDEAIEDLDDALTEVPALALAWLEKATVLARQRRSADALGCLQKAAETGSSQAPPPDGHGLESHMQAWIQNRICLLEERAVQEQRVASGEVGGAHAGDSGATDSGDGSGWWKLEGITGITWDTCLYHLRNHPPAMAHPRPHDLWHVVVWFGSTSREYTPVSTVKQ